MPSDSNQQPSPKLLWIVWGAMLFSLVIYGVVLRFIEPTGEMDPSQLQMMLMAFSVVSATEIGVIFFLRNLLFFGRIEDGEFDDRDEVAQGYFTTSVITWALCEAIGIYGLVLSMLTGDITYFLAFGLVGGALMLYFRPQWEAHVEGAELPDSGDESRRDDSSDGGGQAW